MQVMAKYSTVCNIKRSDVRCSCQFTWCGYANGAKAGALVQCWVGEAGFQLNSPTDWMVVVEFDQTITTMPGALGETTTALKYK